MNFSDPFQIASVLSGAMLAVLFLQSGLDKVTDRAGNLSWLKDHFSKSPLRNAVPLLLSGITIAELLAGLLSAVGVIVLLWRGHSQIAMYGAAVSALSILMLFSGQRIAKDYQGAASLVPYFLLALAALLLNGFSA